MQINIHHAEMKIKQNELIKAKIESKGNPLA